MSEHLDEQYRSGARVEELGINLTYTGVQKWQKMQHVPFCIHIFQAEIHFIPVCRGARG